MPGRQAVHALSLGRILIAASDGRGEAALIDMHGLEAATKVSLAKPQTSSSVQRAALFVARRFFPGPFHLVERVPDAMARDPEMPGRFGLRQVVLRGDVMPQGLPIQFAGGVRPRSPVRQPSGFESPVHARLAHRDPPSRLCLAAAAVHKTHHAQAHIQ